jgi:hypothetical protein
MRQRKPLEFWNYRVAKEDGLFSIRVVNYQETKTKSRINEWGRSPYIPTASTREELLTDIRMMLSALDDATIEVVGNKITDK